MTNDDDRSVCEKEAVDGIASAKPLAAISIRCPMIVANAFGPEVCDVCQRRRARRDMWAGRIERCPASSMDIGERRPLRKVSKSSPYRWLVVLHERFRAMVCGASGASIRLAICAY